MTIDSKYTKVFTSDSLTDLKYNELHAYAVYLREWRNNISREVNDNLLKYMEMSPLNFVTYMRTIHSGEVNSNFDKHLYRLVIDCYRNKFDDIKHKMEFSVREFKGFEHFKRDCKSGRKGQLKKINYKEKKTPLSNCLTYLVRYGFDGTVEYIKSKMDDSSIEEKKRAFYQNILRCIEKFGFARLMALALQRRNQVIRKYFAEPIEFKSLTFGGRSRKKLILGENKNKGSVIKAFINLSWETRTTMAIPVKYASKYHGSFSEYEKRTNDYEYLITFNEKHKRVNVNLVKDGVRTISEVTDKDAMVGIDVNIKHNLFSLSNGETYDYDRNLMKEYCRICSEVDSLKKKDEEYSVGRKKQYRIDAIRRKILFSNRQLISKMCKSLQEQGIRHIVMEDLGTFGKTYVKSDDFESLNFNRVIRALHLTDLKNEVEHIANGYGIVVSLVQSEYTSKRCPVCGCIEDENRLSQEEFRCVHCGHADNADHNAAINIRNRVLEAVREDLLKQNDNGSWSPKKLKKEKIKEILLKSVAVQDMSGHEMTDDVRDLRTSFS